MATVDQTFPGFVQACGTLYADFLPWTFVLLLMAFIFEFWSGPPNAFGMMKFIILLFIVILVIANSNGFITTGQTFVQQWVQQNIPASPEKVAARYAQQLALAQNAPQSNTTFWSTLFSTNWFDAIIYACLTLLSWLAIAMMYFVYAVQRAVLLLCWAVCPLLLPLLAIRPLSYLGLRHVLRIVAIMLWPVGNALGATFTDGLISAAVNQSLLANQTILGSLGYGLQNLLAVAVIGIWIIFSTILAPAFIQRIIVGSSGAASAISRTSEAAFATGAPMLGGAFACGWERVVHGGGGSTSSSNSNDGFAMSSPPPSPPSSDAWQPGPNDPAGDK